MQAKLCSSFCLNAIAVFSPTAPSNRRANPNEFFIFFLQSQLRRDVFYTNMSDFSCLPRQCQQVCGWLLSFEILGPGTYVSCQNRLKDGVVQDIKNLSDYLPEPCGERKRNQRDSRRTWLRAQLGGCNPESHKTSQHGWQGGKLLPLRMLLNKAFNIKSSLKFQTPEEGHFAELELIQADDSSNVSFQG